MRKNIDWARVDARDVLSAIEEFDRLGAADFLRRYGFAPTTTYDLRVNERTYPPKAVLGAAFELATGERLSPSDFEGGRTGAVKILSRLGYEVRERDRAN
jgi:hypothetical protein